MSSPTDCGDQARCPRITLIVAVKNGASTIDRCLQSIANQTYRNRQFIVVDGASTDDTMSVVHRYRDYIDCSWSEPDNGIYDAWNKGLSLATGDWVMFMGADDFFKVPDALCALVKSAMLSRSDADLYYGRVDVVNGAGRTVRTLGVDWTRARAAFFNGVMLVPHSGMLHRATLFREYGKFDDTFRIAGDYEFLLRIVVNRPPRFLNSVCAISMGNSGISSSLSTRYQSLLEARRARAKHRIGGIPWHWYVALLKTLLHSLRSKAGTDWTAQVMSKLRQWTSIWYQR